MCRYLSRFILSLYQASCLFITSGYGIRLCRSSQALSTCLYGFWNSWLSMNSFFGRVSLVRCRRPCSHLTDTENGFRWLSCIMVRMKSLSLVSSRAYWTRSSLPLHTSLQTRYSFRWIGSAPVSTNTHPVSVTGSVTTCVIGFKIHTNNRSFNTNNISNTISFFTLMIKL